MGFLNKSLAIAGLVCLCGCASTAERYQAIRYDHVLTKHETVTIAQYHLSLHPLKDNFKKRPKGIGRANGIDSVYFDSRGDFNYLFLVDVQRSSGKILGSGLIPVEASQPERMQTEFLKALTDGDLLLLGFVAKFYEDNSRWPAHSEELSAWIEKTMPDKYNSDSEPNPVRDPLARTEFIISPQNRLELRLTPTPQEIEYYEYYYDPDTRKKRIILMSKDKRFGAFKVRYPQLSDADVIINVTDTTRIKRQEWGQGRTKTKYDRSRSDPAGI